MPRSVYILQRTHPQHIKVITSNLKKMYPHVHGYHVIKGAKITNYQSLYRAFKKWEPLIVRGGKVIRTTYSLVRREVE